MQCEQCKGIAWSDHRCPPAWRVRDALEIYGETEPVTVYASSASAAAEVYAQQKSTSEQWHSSRSVEVMTGHVWTLFFVQVLYVPTYHAEERTAV